MTTLIQKQNAISDYYLNPNKCLNCNKIIDVDISKKRCVDIARVKQFCNHSCSAIYNNKHRPRKIRKYVCKNCRKEFHLVDSSRRTYCVECYSTIKRMGLVENFTKAQLFQRYDRYYIARNAIRSRASSLFSASNKEKRCAICGYDKHIHVAHIKDVSSFPDDTLISTINNLDNLIALCPNHHWEYDHGFIDLHGNQLKK